MHYEKISIYPKGVYRDAGGTGFQPSLRAYVLDSPTEKPRPAVVICPGGGYGNVSWREGEPVATRFLAAGFHAFVLDYSVAPNRYPKQVAELSRAFQIVRQNAGKWLVDPNKIAVCGFSAGGHLAANLAVDSDNPEILAAAKAQKGENKPNAAILCYPVLTAGERAHRGSFENLTGGDEALTEKLSLEKLVSPKTPPTFLWHTAEDGAVPVENSLLFAGALRKNGVPFALHIFEKGSHGLSTADAETAAEPAGVMPQVARWLTLCIEWLWERFA
jgi:acetyl esterase/lipase